MLQLSAWYTQLVLCTLFCARLASVRIGAICTAVPRLRQSKLQPTSTLPATASISQIQLVPIVLTVQ